MAQYKLYRDNVHGDILLSELAVRIIDTPEFQRLDGIKQLGFANLVYRGAKHTRFDHSIGSYWMAQKIVNVLSQNYKRLGKTRTENLIEILHNSFGSNNYEALDALKDTLGIAGVLHDISHIPFGHTLEDEFNDYYIKHDALESLRIYYLMFDKRSNIAQIFEDEDDSQRYVGVLSNDELRRLLFLIVKFRDVSTETIRKPFEEIIDKTINSLNEPNHFFNNKPKEKEEAVKMLRQLRNDYLEFTNRSLFHPFMSDIIANTICADLLDYLARDCNGTGLQLQYDKRILHYFIIGFENISGKLRLCLMVKDLKGVERVDITTEIINLMRMRYSLAERVYYHKMKVGASAMLAKLLSEFNVPSENNPYDDSTGNESILNLTEDKLLNSFIDKDGREAPLAKMIRERKVYKPLIIIPHTFARGLGLQARLMDFRDSAEALTKRTRMEEELNKMIGNDKLPNVIIYCPSHKMQAKEVKTPILIEAKSYGNTILPLNQQTSNVTLKQEVESLNHKYQELWKFFVFIHPEVLTNEVACHSIIWLFCNKMNIPIERAQELCPYGFQAPLELLSHWVKEHNRLSDYPPDSDEVYEQMFEIANNNLHWKKEIIDRLPKKETTFDGIFCEMFLIISINMVFEARRKDFSYGSDTKRGKKSKEDEEKENEMIEAFREQMLNKIDAKWLSEIMAKVPARANKKTSIQVADFVLSEWQEFCAKKIAEKIKIVDAQMKIE